jgi:hypothetical protein
MRQLRPRPSRVQPNRYYQEEASRLRESVRDDTELVLLPRDAFAADYQEDEYVLLGMAIMYAGRRGKEVGVIGKNRSILGEGDSIQ